MQINSHKSFLLKNLQILPFKTNKEEVTRRKIIDPIVELAGFRDIDIESVEEEFDAQTNNSIYPIEIDLCLKKDGRLLVFIQCKQLGSKHRIKDDYKKTFEAGQLKRIPWVIFTDGEYWEFYELVGLEYKGYKQINLRYDQSKYQEIVTILQNIRQTIYG